MAKPKITLFLDTHFPVFRQCEVTYVPVFLGGLMHACGNKAPLEIKNKDKWTNAERLRWCRLFNIPISETTPEGFPPRTLDVQRALCAIQLTHPDKLTAAFSALYHAFWIEHKPLDKPESFAATLASVLGEDIAKSIMEKSKRPEVKKLLTDNTQMAFDEGAFGLPWFVATNSKGEKAGTWGFDHLGQVAEFLGLERPASGGWRAML